MSPTHATVFSKPPSLPCFDAGSEFCPCSLAELGYCVACSLLRGENRCDCGWSGICVYEEYSRETAQIKPIRREWEAEVTHREEIPRPGDTSRRMAFWFRVKASEELTKLLVLPGSFAFVRSAGTTHLFNVPLSVMDVERDALTFACEVLGPKTAALERHVRPGTRVTLKGPFWSGLQGLGPPRTFVPARTLIVAKGMGQAPAVFLARFLKSGGGTVRILLGPGSLGTVFVSGILAGMDVPATEMPRESDHNTGRIVREIVSNCYDLVVSCNADQQHRALWKAISNLPRRPAFAWISDVTMSCGEGICGSCLEKGAIRLCKGILQPEERFDGGEEETE